MSLSISRIAIAGVFVLNLGLGQSAWAHFLFIRVGPMAEGGRSAEVFFSEQAEAGDPKFVDKIEGTALWLQTKPGAFAPLKVRKGTDRLRASVPPSGSLSVVGTCEYGVLARPNETAFLLRYYPKAVAGKPLEVNTFSRYDVPGRLEIMPTFEDDRVTLALVRDGKPIPGVEFHAVDSKLSEATFSAASDGRASWSPSAPGRYSIYVKQVIKSPGDYKDKHYDEIREFATLAFTWPLDRGTADPEAVSLFQKAVATRAQWTDFPGFSAEVSGAMDGRVFSGKLAVSAEGSVKADVDEPLAKPWLEDQLGSIAMHRLAEPDSESPILRFADDEESHPLGRLLAFQGGQFASSYRAKDKQLSVVNRHIGGQVMTITVLDTQATPEGKFLPRSYVVQSWSAVDGELARVESVQERWTRVGAFDLPASHVVSNASGRGFSVRSIALTKHRLAESSR
jgi:Protein of unknown function (DUF3386)